MADETLKAPDSGAFFFAVPIQLMVPKKGLELEPFCWREWSGSQQEKS
jgi:hypothetical protein